MTALNGIILVFVGGGFGSLSRFGISMGTAKYYKGSFPVGTLLSNALACLTLGIALYFLRDKIGGNEWLRYLVVIGFCGGFSTFSAFSFETVKLMQDGMYAWAIANILISLALGIGVLFLFSK